MIFISPTPGIWNKIHINLERFWITELNQKGTPPPKPLILAGWNYSSDSDKKERWNQTVTWAKHNACSDLIPELEDDQKYCVKELIK